MRKVDEETGKTGRRVWATGREVLFNEILTAMLTKVNG